MELFFNSEFEAKYTKINQLVFLDHIKINVNI